MNYHCIGLTRIAKWTDGAASPDLEVTLTHARSSTVYTRFSFFSLALQPQWAYAYLHALDRSATVIGIYIYVYIYICTCMLNAKNTHCDGGLPNVFDVPLMMVLWEPKHVRLLGSEVIKSSWSHWTELFNLRNLCRIFFRVFTKQLFISVN
jgi:hypothetical protein